MYPSRRSLQRVLLRLGPRLRRDAPDGIADIVRYQHGAGLVHGHTHQPMLHRWPAPAGDDSGIDGERRRWVLSDWSAAPPRGDVLSLNTVMPEAAGA